MYAPQKLTISNPATGEDVGSVPVASRADVIAAVERARVAQIAWGARSYAERCAVIRRFHDLVLDRTTEVLTTIQSESGKARRDAISEVLAVAATSRYYLTHGRQHLRERRARPALSLATSARELHRPLGVVGMITPWNFPFLLAVGDSIPALLAGNAVVVKPSEITPLSAELAASLLREAGLPDDLYSWCMGRVTRWRPC